MYDREVVHNQHDSMIKEINELQAKNQELEAQVGQMRKALEIIANPIKYLREVAEKQGRRLDCNVTFKLADSANYLSGIAEIALQTPVPARWEEMCRVVEATNEYRKAQATLANVISKNWMQEMELRVNAMKEAEKILDDALAALEGGGE